jgi:hypothetical protein
MIFNSIFSTWTAYPTNGCHATSTREAHALHGVGGSCGAQAVRDLQMGHMSRVEKPVSMCSSKCGGTKLLYCALMRQDERRHTLYGVCLTFGSMWDTLLRACLPLQWNERCAYITCVTHMRKRETRVLGAFLALGPHGIKFQAPRPPPVVLNLSLRAWYRLIPSLGAHRHLIPSLRAHRRVSPDLTGDPLLELGFLVSSTMPPPPSFSTQLHRLPSRRLPQPSTLA